MTKVKRLAAVLLAVIMMFSSSITVFAASYKKTTVTLPEGRSYADAASTADELWKFAYSDVLPLITDQIDFKYGLEPLLTYKVFTNEMIGKIYGLIANLSHMNNSSARGLISQIFEQKNIAGMLYESKFSGAQAKILAATAPVDGDGNPIQIPVTRTDADGNDYETTEDANVLDGIALIQFESGDFGFQDYDKAGFVNGLVAAIRPLTYVLGNHMSGVNVDTEGVYRAIVPVFEELGCKLPTPDDFMDNFYDADDVNPYSSGDVLLTPILNSLLNDVLSSKALADPVNAVLELLPRIANIIDKDMINPLIRGVISSIPIAASFVDPSSINIDKAFINKVITNLDLIELITKESAEVKLTLSAPDWTKLANASDAKSTASALGGKYELRTGDKGVVFSLLFYYLYDNFLGAKYPIVKGLVEKLLGGTLSGLVTGYTDRLNAAGRVETFEKLIAFFDEDNDATADAGKSIADTINNVNEVLNFGKIDASKATIKLSKKVYTYNGKIQKPTVKVTLKGVALAKGTDFKVSYSKGSKKIGSYKVTVKFIGTYKGKATAAYRIAPKGTKIAKLTAAKAALKAKWNKQAKQTTGYEVQVATDKSFKKNVKTVTVKGAKKTSKKISGLISGKKYYVRVRTYKTVSGKKVASKWSKAKTVKVK